MNDALVLITNSENQSFGTGFVIKKELDYSYILTCSHVVEHTPNTLFADSIKAEIIYIGSSDGLDLAVLKVKIDRKPLELLDRECDSFEIKGFKSFKNSDHILEPIDCKLDTKVQFRPKNGGIVYAWKLNIDISDTVERGYSGSPLICKESGKVVGIISNRNGKKYSFAISINHLKDIWKDIPKNLIKEEEYTLKKNLIIANTSLGCIEFEEPSGTVALDSLNYIKRKDDQKCYDNLLQRYSLIRIKAPRQYGKTSLLARLIFEAKKKDYTVVSFNFQEFDIPLLGNLEELLSFICDIVAYELEMEIQISPRIVGRLTPKLKATKYMEIILSKLDKPLLLAIDEADKLFDYSKVSDDFFGLIRAWHEKSKVDKSWENLKILLSHSTEPLLESISINESPFHNVGLGIELQAFTKNELKDLIQRHGLIFDDKTLEDFKVFLGGHPYLSRKVLYVMATEKQSFKQIMENAYTDKSIFNEHMRRYLWLLKDDIKLTELVKSILKNNFIDDDISCYKLESTGLIKNVINKPQFSCELYKEFFYKKF